MSWIELVLALIGGLFAGSINTLAGNGSAITLTIFTELLGLPGNMANGTNRVGVFAQTSAGAWAFYRQGKLDYPRQKTYIWLTAAGALGGMSLALVVSNEQFMGVFRFFMIAMLGVILVRPKRWLRESDPDFELSNWIKVPLFLAIGFYGGFLQMGMGIFFLAAMVLAAHFSIIEGNAVKLLVIGIYTIVALALFQWKGLIHWQFGLTVAVSQMLGGYVTALFAARHPKANVWAHRLLVVVVILAIFKLFDIHLLIFGQ